MSNNEAPTGQRRNQFLNKPLDEYLVEDTSNPTDH